MPNQAPADRFDKHQNQVEMATCGLEFMVARVAAENVIDLRCMLQSFGAPLDGPHWMNPLGCLVATSPLQQV